MKVFLQYQKLIASTFEILFETLVNISLSLYNDLSRLSNPRYHIHLSKIVLQSALTVLFNLLSSFFIPPLGPETVQFFTNERHWLNAAHNIEVFPVGEPFPNFQKRRKSIYDFTICRQRMYTFLCINVRYVSSYQFRMYRFYICCKSQ